MASTIAAPLNRRSATIDRPIAAAAARLRAAGRKNWNILATSAVILVLTAVWCRRIPPHTGSAAIVVILAFNPVLVQNAVAIVSDAMFAALAMAALLWMDDRELRGRETLGSSVVAGVLIWAACS